MVLEFVHVFDHNTTIILILMGTDSLAVSHVLTPSTCHTVCTFELHPIFEEVVRYPSRLGIHAR